MRKNFSSPSSVIAIDLFASSLGAIIMLFLITVPFMNVDVSAASLIESLKAKSEELKVQNNEFEQELAQSKVQLQSLRSVKEEIVEQHESYIDELSKQNELLINERNEAIGALNTYVTTVDELVDSVSDDVLSQFMAKMNVADASSLTGVYKARQKCFEISATMHVQGDKFGNVKIYTQSRTSNGSEELYYFHIEEGYLLTDNTLLKKHVKTLEMQGGWTTHSDSRHLYEPISGNLRTSFTCQSSRRKGAFEVVEYERISDTLTDEVIRLLDAS